MNRKSSKKEVIGDATKQRFRYHPFDDIRIPPSISEDIKQMLSDHGIREDEYNKAREKSGLDNDEYDVLALKNNSALGKLNGQNKEASN